ncbi:MAG TPA: DUF2231 domain-containing protein [bacterium]|nr:DUF2231 domain-containing protein [bacterium]
MPTIEPTSAAGIIPAVQHFVMGTKLHPIFVNFTAALVPISIATDFAARFLKRESLRSTAWWTLLFATAITPLTAVSGWLFWMADDNGVSGMTIHKWLGTGLAVLLVLLFMWRYRLNQKRQWATLPYLLVGAIFVIALTIQGHLGGEQVFSGM